MGSLGTSTFETWGCGCLCLCICVCVFVFVWMCIRVVDVLVDIVSDHIGEVSREANEFATALGYGMWLRC